MDLNIQSVKTKLEEERAKIEAELSTVATKVGGDWQAVYDKSEGDDSLLENEPDSNDIADSLEELDERNALVNDVLEVRLKEINDALAAITDGTYGICKMGDGNHKIEKERLEVNPAATTCTAHMN